MFVVPIVQFHPALFLCMSQLLSHQYVCAHTASLLASRLTIGGNKEHLIYSQWFGHDGNTSSSCRIGPHCPVLTMFITEAWLPMTFWKSYSFGDSLTYLSSHHNLALLNYLTSSPSFLCFQHINFKDKILTLCLPTGENAKR